jgi:hypothetical protein
MGLATDTILLGIAILIVYTAARLPSDRASGLVGVIGGAVVLLGYLGSAYARVAGEGS